MLGLAKILPVQAIKLCTEPCAFACRPVSCSDSRHGQRECAEQQLMGALLTHSTSQSASVPVVLGLQNFSLLFASTIVHHMCYGAPVFLARVFHWSLLSAMHVWY